MAGNKCARWNGDVLNHMQTLHDQEQHRELYDSHRVGHRMEMGHLYLPTKTVLKGGLKVAKIAGMSTGADLADGITEVTINTILFGSCIYTVQTGKSMGDLTEGKPATFHINAVVHKTEGSAASCPITGIFTATYTLTEPKETTLSVSDSTD